MEKRIIPVTLGNDKLRSIISEIIVSNNIFGNLEFQLTDKNDLNKNNKSILIADNEFAVKELSPEIKFDTIFIHRGHTCMLKLICKPFYILEKNTILHIPLLCFVFCSFSFCYLNLLLHSCIDNTMVKLTNIVDSIH